MTVERIAIRQEVRQMLNEAGINKNTLKDMVKEVLQEELKRAIFQALQRSAFGRRRPTCTPACARFRSCGSRRRE